MSIVERSYSEAVAYMLLLIRVDWHLEDLAELLAVSREALKSRLRSVGLRARIQPTLFDGIDRIDPEFRPMRRIRWIRPDEGVKGGVALQNALWA